MSVLQTTDSVAGVNRSFRTHKGQIFTYSQKKNALSFFYGKRKVLADAMSTEPTDM